MGEDNITFFLNGFSHFQLRNGSALNSAVQTEEVNQSGMHTGSQLASFSECVGCSFLL